MPSVSSPANQVRHQLTRLIKSLTKSEKRNFKLFAKRGGATSESQFIRLFDRLDRADEPDDERIRRQLKLTPARYAGLKHHLYQQVLTSLRLVYISKEIDIELREQIDFTRILYGKGHYLDALRTLERAKAKAVEHSQDLLHLEILEFQKLIEARHITLSRQVDNKMDLLLNESAQRCYSVLDTSELFSLNIQIHGRYIETGHGRTPEQRRDNATFWHHIQTQRVDRETSPSTFNQRVNRHQAEMWYHYIQLDFPAALSAARDAYSLFSLNGQMIIKDPDLYLRCLYYVTMLAYLSEDHRMLRRYVARLHAAVTSGQLQLNQNSQQIGRTYLYLAEFNSFFAHDDRAGARELVGRIQREHAAGDFRPTNHRWGLFLYKLAATDFLHHDYDAALDHLNEIINMRATLFREDLLINTRLLHAFCHYELGNESLVDYHLTSLQRLLSRSREAAGSHRTVATGLRRLIKTPLTDRATVYAQIDEELAATATDAFEQKTRLYLDVRRWLHPHLPATGR